MYEAEPIFWRSLEELGIQQERSPEILLRRYARKLAGQILSGRMPVQRGLDLMHRRVVSPLEHSWDLIPWCYLWEGIDPFEFSTSDDRLIEQRTLEFARQFVEAGDQPTELAVRLAVVDRKVDPDRGDVVAEGPARKGLFSLEGTWRGAYEYPKGMEGPGSPVPFTMSLRQNGFFKVLGTVQEDLPFGFPEAGSVSGRAGLFSISLEKRMPVLRLWDGDRTVPFAEWYTRIYGIGFQQVAAHPVIHLSGRLSRWRGAIEGIWRSPAISITDRISGRRFDFPDLSGQWYAQREGSRSRAAL